MLMKTGSRQLFTGLIMLASFTAFDVEARDRVVDHRGVPPIRGTAGYNPGYASPGSHIKCIIPFCGNDFRPQRERVRDHRPASPPNRPPKR